MLEWIKFQIFKIRYELHRIPDKIWMAIAWKLPKRLALWCAVRVGAHATTGEYSNQNVPKLTFMNAIERWDK